MQGTENGGRIHSLCECSYLVLCFFTQTNTQGKQPTCSLPTLPVCSSEQALLGKEVATAPRVYTTSAAHLLLQAEVRTAASTQA